MARDWQKMYEEDEKRELEAKESALISYRASQATTNASSASTATAEQPMSQEVRRWKEMEEWAHQHEMEMLKALIAKKSASQATTGKTAMSRSGKPRD